MLKRSHPFILILGLALLGLGLMSCGGKSSMEAGGQEEGEVGTVTEGEDASAEPTPVMAADESEEPQKEEKFAKGDTSSGEDRPESYKVKAGDTLWKIANRGDIYGSGWLYPLIFKANKDKFKDPNNLAAGLVLKIPRDVAGTQMEIAREEAMTGQFVDTSPLVAEAPRAVPAAAAQKKEAPKRSRKGLFLTLAAVLAAAGGAAWWWKKRHSSAP